MNDNDELRDRLSYGGNPRDTGLAMRPEVAMARIRELYERMQGLQATVSSLQTTIDRSQTSEGLTAVPPMTNFVDNSDFVFSHAAYSFATDPTADYILAKWYARAQGGTSAYNVNGTFTESSQSVRTSTGQGTTVPFTGISSNTVSLDNDPSVLRNGMEVTLGATKYYVINATTTTVQLASSAESTTPATLSDSGSGNLVTDFSATAGSRKVVWDTDTGTLATCGGYVTASPLTSRYAFLGNNIYTKLQIIHKPKAITVTRSSNKLNATAHGLVAGTEVTVRSTESIPAPLQAGTVYYVKSPGTDDFELSAASGGPTITLEGDGAGTITVNTRVKKGLKCRLSLWDNLNNRIFRGDYPTLQTAKIGTHPNTGGVARQYILEVQMPDGRRFYSDLDTFTAGQNEAEDTVSTAAVSDVNFVAVRWGAVVGASRYNVYRRTDSGPWYLVGAVPSTSTLLFDYGGSGVSEFTPPVVFGEDQQQFQAAEALVSDVTDGLYGTELVAIEINSNIQFPTIIDDFSSTGDQFLQIEFLKPDNSNTDLADIPANTLLIDKVALSYVYGRWQPSARDQAMSPEKVIPTAPVATGGGGDGTGTTPSGGGGGTVEPIEICVQEDTPILVWSDNGDHYEMAAHMIAMGDRLVSWDGEKLAPSKVKAVTTGISRLNYRIYAGGKELICSFSHRLIEDFDDFPKGTNVGNLHKKVLIMGQDGPEVAGIQGIESIEAPMRVITFRMEKGRENYVSGGIFSHNNKRNDRVEIIF